MTGPERLLLDDDGLVPNNARVAVRIYRRAMEASGDAPEQGVIARFAANGWGGAWINGIYPFHHYHALAHEVLGIARGWAEVQLGGPGGPKVRIVAGDGVLIPAGVGHCRLDASPDLSVVGAYPAGQEDYDLKRATPAERLQALTEIPLVPMPERDPVLGTPFSGTLTSPSPTGCDGSLRVHHLSTGGRCGKEPSH